MGNLLKTSDMLALCVTKFANHLSRVLKISKIKSDQYYLETYVGNMNIEDCNFSAKSSILIVQVCNYSFYYVQPGFDR